MNEQPRSAGERGKCREASANVPPAFRCLWLFRIALVLGILSGADFLRGSGVLSERLFAAPPLSVLSSTPVANRIGALCGVLIVFFFAVNWRFVGAKLREMKDIEGFAFPWTLIFSVLKGDKASAILLCVIVVEFLVIAVAFFVR